MKKLLALTISLMGFTPMQAQTQEDFDDAGKAVLHMVTDSVPSVRISWIRKKEYFDLIDKQPLSDYQKTVLKEKLNMSFGDDLQKMMNQLEGLQNSYEIERKEGATFEYHETIYEQMDNSVDTYAVRTTYLYKNGKVQNLVSFEYEIAWLGSRFVLISEIKENF